MEGRQEEGIERINVDAIDVDIDVDIGVVADVC